MRYPIVLFGLLYFLSNLVAFAIESSAEPFADWPESWASSYQQFEVFIQTKKDYWPNSFFEIAKDGSVTYALPGKQRLEVFWYGSRGAGWNGSYRGSNVRSFGSSGLDLYKGTYAAYVGSTAGSLYQYCRPTIWFRVVSENPNERDSPKQFEMIPPPRPGDGVWPKKEWLISLITKSLS